MDSKTISASKRSVEQTMPPRPAKETLPTMYDLPSEFPEESGLPDEFHYLQPQLLSATLQLAEYADDEIFSVGDMNLYYDVDHPLWHKRPDWFAVVGVPRLYEGQDLRLSYVVWQERVNPFVVVELLSPGTEKADLGQTSRDDDGTPTKWEVYEQILRIPYYIVFDRYTNQLRAFHLVGGHYQPMEIADQRVMISEWDVSIGVWQGPHRGLQRPWLHWFDAENKLILTAEERAERLAQRLRDLGIDPNEV
ncbi:MAG: Uma2 family endonuclease [Leptolyngbya sp. SIO1D8]|nr:Uma2 family endonuclease [Leptolyngbya sp. SIO1D8]